MGRPPKDRSDKLGTPVKAMMTSDEAAAVEAAADGADKSVSMWARDALLAALDNSGGKDTQ
jgi:hypothetical protein